MKHICWWYHETFGFNGQLRARGEMDPDDETEEGRRA